jgi:CheY-like chemotaxis protein
LASQGFQVDLAGNGQEAVFECAAFRPDMIILDLALPDLDGLDILRLLRERTLAPVIVVSVRDMVSSNPECRSRQIARLHFYSTQNHVKKALRCGDIMVLTGGS